MPDIRWKHDGRKILLPVTILRPDNSLDLTSGKATALLDTGATTSGVGQSVIDALGLISYGKKLLKSAREESFVPYYLFRVGLTADALQDEPMPAIQLPYIFTTTDGFSWSHDTHFEVILGMDVLSQCTFGMDRNGDCSLVFG